MSTAKTKIALKGVRPKPLLKWAGGKRALLPEITKHMPKGYGTYYEPFFGGGALFFHLTPAVAVLADLNAEIINVYKTVRDSPEELIMALSSHLYDKDHYYEVRSIDPKTLSNVDAAARTIYLNRCGFNGLYRVNKKGGFNVPFGRYKNPKIVNIENIYACSDALQDVLIDNINIKDFPWDTVKKNDFVYLDPPYVPLNETSSFTSYTKDGFGPEDHQWLADLYKELSARGVFVLHSNSDTEYTQELYKDFEVLEVLAPRNINSKAAKRAKVSEILVKNYS